AQQSVTVVANSTVNINLMLQAPNPGAHTFGPNVSEGPAIAVNATSTTLQSDVRDISIRFNRILTFQVSIFLLKTEDCDIVGNQCLGLSARALEILRKFTGRPDLNRQSIDSFQQAVIGVLTTSTGTAFQAAAIILLSGTRVTISQNVISGLVGLLSFFLAETRFEDNQVLAFSGII